MPTTLHIATPPQIRQLDQRLRSDMVGWAWVYSWFSIPAGLICLLFVGLAGGVIGAVVCAVWIAAWTAVQVWVRRARRQVDKWRQPIRIGDYYVEFAHERYWKLAPETRINYALPLIKRMYELSLLDARGRQATRRIEHELADRLRALDNLVDAEDALRLSAAGPVLKDRDDVAAARAWQKAVEAIERGINAEV